MYVVYEAYEVKNKRKKMLMSFTSPEKEFFYIFMIVKQKIKKRSTIHYLQSFESRF
jgi:hypothetical protein